MIASTGHVTSSATGLDGVLVPPEDVAGLAAAMDGLLRDDARRIDLARRAVEVRERFTMEQVAQRWETLFAEAMQRR